MKKILAVGAVMVGGAVGMGVVTAVLDINLTAVQLIVYDVAAMSWGAALYRVAFGR